MVWTSYRGHQKVTDCTHMYNLCSTILVPVAQCMHGYNITLIIIRLQVSHIYNLAIYFFSIWIAVLGLHSLITQEQSFAVESEKLGEAIKKFGLRKPGVFSLLAVVFRNMFVAIYSGGKNVHHPHPHVYSYFLFFISCFSFPVFHFLFLISCFSFFLFFISCFSFPVSHFTLVIFDELFFFYEFRNCSREKTKVNARYFTHARYGSNIRNSQKAEKRRHQFDGNRNE